MYNVYMCAARSVQSVGFGILICFAEGLLLEPRCAIDFARACVFTVSFAALTLSENEVLLRVLEVTCAIFVILCRRGEN